MLLLALMSTLGGCSFIFETSASVVVDASVDVVDASVDVVDASLDAFVADARPEIHLTFPMIDNDYDAEEDPGGIIKLSNPHLALGRTDGNLVNLVGLRFADLGIPRGTKINNAYIQFTSNARRLLSTKLEIALEADPNSFPAPFTTLTNNISSRSLTTTRVSWDAAAWEAEYETTIFQQTANIAVLIEEAVAHEQWKDESSLVLIIRGVEVEIGVGAGREARSSEGAEADALAQPPTLHVFY